MGVDLLTLIPHRLKLATPQSAAEAIAAQLKVGVQLQRWNSETGDTEILATVGAGELVALSKEEPDADEVRYDIIHHYAYGKQEWETDFLYARSLVGGPACPYRWWDFLQNLTDESFLGYLTHFRRKTKEAAARWGATSVLYFPDSGVAGIDFLDDIANQMPWDAAVAACREHYGARFFHIAPGSYPNRFPVAGRDEKPICIFDDFSYFRNPPDVRKRDYWQYELGEDRATILKTLQEQIEWERNTLPRAKKERYYEMLVAAHPTDGVYDLIHENLPGDFFLNHLGEFLLARKEGLPPQFSGKYSDFASPENTSTARPYFSADDPFVVLDYKKCSPLVHAAKALKPQIASDGRRYIELVFSRSKDF